MIKLPDTQTVSIELPTVAIPGGEAEVYYQIRKAQNHATFLSMQFYALSILDMFDDIEIDDLDVTLSTDGDGFIYLEPTEADGPDEAENEELEAEIEHWAETINDARDRSFVGFIEALCGGEGWSKDTIEDTIATAYNQMAANDGMPTWEQVSERRRSEMSARELDADTPANQTPTARPRM